MQQEFLTKNNTEKEASYEKDKFYSALKKMGIDSDLDIQKWEEGPSWNFNGEQFEGFWEFYFIDKTKLPAQEALVYEKYKSELTINQNDGWSFGQYQVILESADFKNENIFTEIKYILDELNEYVNYSLAPDFYVIDLERQENFLKEISILISEKDEPAANYFLTVYLKNILDSKKLPKDTSLSSTDADTDWKEFNKKMEERFSSDRDYLKSEEYKMSRALGYYNTYQLTKNQYIIDDVHYNENPILKRISGNSPSAKKELRDFLKDSEHPINTDDVTEKSEAEYFYKKKFFTDSLADKIFLNSNETLSVEEKSLAVDEFLDFKRGGLCQSIEEDLQISLIDLSIPEQYQFLKFIQSKTNNDISQVRQALLKNGTLLLRTFLSLEHNTSLGNKIVELGNRLPEDVAKKIFSKYAELIDLTEGVTEYVQQFQKNKNENESNTDNRDQKIIQDVSEKLIVRAKDILVASMNKSPEEILILLDSIKADAELFKSTIVIEKKNGGTVSLENLRDAQFEKREAGELKESEKQTMRELYSKNYASEPVLQKKLLDSFELSLKNSSTSFYLFTFKDEIKGFDRFDDLGDGKKYFGSFNIDVSMQGATLGESMIEQSVNIEAAKNEVISADCNAVNRIGARYIENGFIATEFTANYYGIPVFSIIRNDTEIPKLFKTKNMDPQDLKLLVSNPRNDIRVFTAPSQQELIPYFENVGKGMVMTRYFEDKETEDWYVVLEKVEEQMIKKDLV